MASAPIYLASRRVSSVLVNTANTDSTGATGSAPTVWTAGASGSLIESVQIKGIVASGATQAADKVSIVAYNGTTNYLVKETLISAGGGNVSATVANVDVVLALNFPLPAGYLLKAITYVGGATASYHVTAIGGDY